MRKIDLARTVGRPSEWVGDAGIRGGDGGAAAAADVDDAAAADDDILVLNASHYYQNKSIDFRIGTDFVRA